MKRPKHQRASHTAEKKLLNEIKFIFIDKIFAILLEKCLRWLGFCWCTPSARSLSLSVRPFINRQHSSNDAIHQHCTRWQKKIKIFMKFKPSVFVILASGSLSRSFNIRNAD
jgi:hypothetical protein